MAEAANSICAAVVFEPLQAYPFEAKSDPGRNAMPAPAHSELCDHPVGCAHPRDHAMPAPHVCRSSRETKPLHCTTTAARDTTRPATQNRSLCVRGVGGQAPKHAKETEVLIGLKTCVALCSPPSTERAVRVPPFQDAHGPKPHTQPRHTTHSTPEAPQIQYRVPVCPENSLLPLLLLPPHLCAPLR